MRTWLTGRTQRLVGQTLAVIVKKFPYSLKSAKFKQSSLSFSFPRNLSSLLSLHIFPCAVAFAHLFVRASNIKQSRKSSCPARLGSASRPFRLIPRATGAVSRAGKPITLFFVPVSREDKTCCILPHTAHTSNARQLLLLGSGGGQRTMHNAQSGPIMPPSVDMRICLAASARCPVLG
jgi:hypothetical protein